MTVKAAWVRIVKVVEVDPAGINALGGTSTRLVKVDCKLTELPPAGAGRLSVSVPVTLYEAVAVDVDKVNPLSRTLLTKTVSESDPPNGLVTVVVTVTFELATAARTGISTNVTPPGTVYEVGD